MITFPFLSFSNRVCSCWAVSFMDSYQGRLLPLQVSVLSITCLDYLFLKDIEILAIILVPLIMTLSRGHTGQIKRTVIMR